MKPMLSAVAPDVLQFPLYASYKLDGIRAIVNKQVTWSRSLKRIPNAYIQQILGQTNDLHGLDGELTVGPSNDPNVMQNTSSGVMSHHGEPDFTYWIFDMWDLADCPYDARLRTLSIIVDDVTDNAKFEGRIKLLPQTIVHNQEEVDFFEAEALSSGYEGVMLRKIDAPYKYGRATPREHYLMKLKRFLDSEAEIIGFTELFKNENAPIIDALGHQRRSAHKVGKIPMNMLGAFQVRDIHNLEWLEFEVGSGLTEAQRNEFWERRTELMGKIVKYKYLPIGIKERPRNPTWLGFRDPIDIVHNA